MIGTKNLDTLPTIDNLRRLTQSLAMLDAILMPDWQWRYYSYNSKWSDSAAMASMRNGSGDDFFILFTTAGAIIGGVGHESEMNVEGQWPGVIDSVPAVFSDFTNEPAFSVPHMTFCLWRLTDSPAWEIGPIKFPDGPDPDGSSDLLYILDGDPSTYYYWAASYYEKNCNIGAITAIYNHEPLTPEIVGALNPEITINDLAEDVMEIGYPISH